MLPFVELQGCDSTTADEIQVLSNLSTGHDSSDDLLLQESIALNQNFSKTATFSFPLDFSACDSSGESVVRSRTSCDGVTG